MQSASSAARRDQPTGHSRAGRSAALLIVLLAAVGGFAPAAAQSDTSPNAAVRVVHGASDAGPLDVYVDGLLAIAGITFPSVADAVALPAGDHRFLLVPSGVAPNQASLATTVNLAANQTYLIAALGSVADFRAELYVVDLSPLDPNRARLRVVHGSPDAGALDPAVTGGGILFPTVVYPTESEYADLTAGTYDLELRAAGTDVATVILPGIVLDPGTVYDVFAIGQAVDGTLQSLTVTTPTGAVEVTGRPASLRIGDCDDLGDEVAELAMVTGPVDESLGQATAAPTENSFTTIPLGLDAILAADHAIAVARSEDEADAVVACGEVGGGLTESGALVVGLRERNGSGLAGIAVLAASVADPATTDVSIFIADELFPAASDSDEGEGAAPTSASVGPVTAAEATVTDGSMARAV